MERSVFRLSFDNSSLLEKWLQVIVMASMDDEKLKEYLQKQQSVENVRETGESRASIDDDMKRESLKKEATNDTLADKIIRHQLNSS